MKFDVFSLRKGENHFQFEETSSHLDLPTELGSEIPIKVNVVVTKRGTNLILKGEVSCSLNLECSRCLKPFRYELGAPLNAHFILGEDISESSVGDEIIRISHADQSVNLIEIVREGILLAIPYKPLCHSNCKGLCPVCGRNLNKEECDCITASPDPRWAVLKDLEK